ncbi:MAG: hypothetical protein CL843_17050 [Crocinitomicaceae bacterium]|nr:hypothetical protein [Crocinitomicaceae bacterium]|tara:strand:- start:9910 stop:10728 length:819 start_codon:yes stop_codon:yes gene_type:complete
MSLFFRKLLIGIVVLMFLASSCKQRAVIPSKKPENIRTQELLKAVDSNRFEPSYVSMRANARFQSGNTSNSFKANIRMQRDSIIWISVSAYGYEAARLLATPDSVFLINRSEKSYFKGKFDFLNKKLNVTLDFGALQDILLGNPLGLDSLENIKRSNTKEHYMLSSVNKRKLKKLEEKPDRFDDDIFYSSWVDPSNFRVAKMSVLDLKSNQSATFLYSKFEPLEKNNVAQVLKAVIQANQHGEAEVEFQKISIEESLSFPFTIPSKYEPISK